MIKITGKTIMRFCAVLILITTAISYLLSGCSYTKNLEVMNRKQACQDLDYLSKNIKAIHPKPFSKITERDFDERVSEAKHSFAKKVSIEDVYKRSSEIVSLMHDSHLRTYPPYVCVDKRCLNKKLFPIVIAYNKGVATVTFVEKSIDVNCVKSGDELIAINDKKVYCWLDQLSKYQGAETKLQEYNNVIVKFNWLLLLEIGEQNTFDLTVSDSNGIHKNVSVPAIVWTGKNEWKGMQSAANKNEKNAAPFSYSMHMDAKVCLFKAKTFYRLQDNLQGKSTLLAEFESVMNKVFSECRQKNTEVLIFDIRDNSGGNGSMPYKFLRCAANKPYKEGAKSWRYSAAYKKANLICGLMYYKVPAFLHLENVLKLEWFWDPYLPEKHDGEYYVGDSNGLQKPYTCWKGTLVILVDRQTASAAKDAAVIVKDNHLGYIAGEETGGSASEATEVCHIFLPNSGIDCQIPSAYYLRPAGYDDGRGVLPDIELDLKKPDDVLIIQIYQDLQNRNQKH